MIDVKHKGPHTIAGPLRRAGGRNAWLTMGILIASLSSGVCHAQTSVSGRGRNFVAPVTDAQGRKSVLKGREVKSAGKGLVEITGMQAETYRGQAKDMIVEAPQCIFDTKSSIAYSPGALSIRTADGRFSIQGEAFRWQLGDSRLNSKLTISNRVHSLVRKRLIGPKATLMSGAASTAGAGGRTATPGMVSTNVPPKSGAADSPEDFIEITSDEFDYQGDMAIFHGNVRVHETEGDLICGILTVLFGGANGALERIEAERDVVLTQGNTRAMSDKAVYTVGEGKEVVEFLGHAVWEDGERQGSGERLVFDRRNRLLVAEQKAYLKLPRSALGGAGFLSAAPVEEKPGQAAKNGASPVEVFSDVITIRLPLTNGPVREVIAERNVLIVDPEQNGRALADRAVYQDATGLLELTGSPMMETEKRLVTGGTLRFDRATKIFTAAPDAYVKLPFQAVADLRILPRGGSAQMAPAATNQFIEIWAKAFEYQTNLLQFRGSVRANFLEGDVARGKLTCETMTIRHGDHLESMVAEKAVELEQFAVPGAARPVSRKVNCEMLTARFNAQGRLETAFADLGVRAEQEERQKGQDRPVITQLTSASVTAFFARQTNKLDRVVADKDVVFAQDNRIARGAKAVYTEASGLVELTGQPTATMPEGYINGAERLIWDRALGRFIGKGKFKSEWKRTPGPAKNLSLPATSPGPAAKTE